MRYRLNTNSATDLPERWILALALALATLIAVPGIGAAQDADGSRQYGEERPAEVPKLFTVRDVEVEFSRLKLHMEKPDPVFDRIPRRGWTYIVPGTYRAPGGAAFLVRDRRILRASDPAAGIRSLRVASIDEVSPRQGGPPGIVLQDRRGRALTLPDGRYVNWDGVLVQVRGGTITGYGWVGEKPDPLMD